MGDYVSNYICMIGTLFLFCYWPSFNCALAPEEHQQFIVVNTILSITASVISSVLSSRIYYGKSDMKIFQNATLAGGVAIGSCTPMLVSGGVALLIGFVAGIISTIGFIKVKPMLERFGFNDTCGVHALHGMPALAGGIIGYISCMSVDNETAERTFAAVA